MAETVVYDAYAPNAFRADGAILDRRAACEGYALAFKYCINRLGIPSAMVTGTSMGQDHAWNIVMLDGAYYNLDITWDAPAEGTGASAGHDYFYAAMPFLTKRIPEVKRRPLCRLVHPANMTA